MELVFLFSLMMLQAVGSALALAAAVATLYVVRKLEKRQATSEELLRELSASLINAVLGREDGKGREARHLDMIEGLVKRVADIADPHKVPDGYRTATAEELETIMEKRAEAQEELARIAALADPDPDLRPRDEAISRGFQARLAARAARKKSPTIPEGAVEMPMPMPVLETPTGSEGL